MSMGLAVAGEASQKRALLIGINDYLANDPDREFVPEDVWVPEDLGGALNDVALLSEVLQRRFGFPAETMRILRDQEATRERLLDAFDRLVAETGPDDVVFVHFSGHGSQVADLNGDESDGMDETILPHDARTPGVADITDDELGAILARLPTNRVLVSIDACHSGTATRGGAALTARMTPADSRPALYEGTASPTAADGGPGHVLFTGAADNQSALDGPIEDGRHYGLFSLSLGRTLERMPSEASARAVHAAVRQEMQRIGDRFGLYALPHAQLEGAPGALDSPLLESEADAERAWLGIGRDAKGAPLLLQAARLAVQAGSLWAVYPPGETEFRPGDESAILEAGTLAGEDGVIEVQGRGEVPVGMLAEGSRAVLLAPAPPGARVPVRLGDMPPERHGFWVSRLTGGMLPVEVVNPGERALYELAEVNGAVVLRDATGLNVIAAASREDPAGLELVFRGEIDRRRRVGELLALQDPSSPIEVAVRVNPVDLSGATRGVALVGADTLGAFRIRAPGEPRLAANSLQLEVTTSHDSYLTVVNVDPRGDVAILFPNALSERRGFLPGGAVRGGEAIRLPDSLGPNRAGFHWDLVPPSGTDTLVVFAAADLALADKLRAHLGRIAESSTVRGGGTTSSRVALYRDRNTSGQRGSSAVAAQAGTRPTGWGSAAVTVLIEEADE